MLSDMGFWSGRTRTYRFGKACKWRASEKLMGMMEEVLSSCTTTTPSLFDHRCLQHRCGSPPGTTQQVGLRPRMVLPVDLRTDWDSELSEAGLEHLSRWRMRRKRQGQ